MVDFSIGNLVNVTPGTYTVSIHASASTGTKTYDVQLIVSSGAPSLISSNSPQDCSTGVSNLPELIWTANNTSTSYELEVATDSNFVNVIISETGLTTTYYTILNNLLFIIK